MTNMELITATTLSTPAASVTFNSIPQTYNHLLLKYSVRGTESNFTTGITLLLNNNSSTVNSRTTLTGTGTTASSSQSSLASLLFGGTMPSASNTASTFGSSEIFIPNYTSSSNKPFSLISVSEGNTTTSARTYIHTSAQLIRDTNPITRIDLTPNDFSFEVGSTFRLYGISNT